MVMLGTSSPSSALIPVGGGFAGVGLVFFLIGFGLMRSGRRWRRRAERARATIVSLDATGPVSRRTGSGIRLGGSISPGVALFPTVTFTTADGREVRATSHFGSSPAPGRVGETVTVLYDPRDPQRVRIDNVRGRGTCMGVLLMILGAVLAAIGVAVLSLA